MEDVFLGITMTDHFRWVGAVILLLMITVLIRAIKGPSTIDRIVAVNVIGTKATVLLILIGMIYERVDMFVDLALTYAILNFIASIAAARLLRRRSMTDAWEDLSPGEN